VRAAELARHVPEAAPALLALLDPARGPLQPPIRSEIFGPQRFAQHGLSLGLTHRSASVARRWQAGFSPRLRDNIAMLREAQRYIGTQAEMGVDLSPAAEWLLDNFHLIDAQLKEVHEGLPRSYFRTLPLLPDEPLAGLPRIYGLAWAFVAHTDGGFDEELLRHYLAAYQQSCELRLGEIWALPTTLRVVLIENLRRLAERVACHKAARELANLCCDQLDSGSPREFDALLRQLVLRGVDRVFLVQLAQRLLKQPHDADNPNSPIQAWLRLALPDLATLLAQQDADQAADNLSVSNAVSSLRAIGDADWGELVDGSSLLMQRLLSAPGFAAEHAASRELSLHAIEGLARRSRHSELAVAEALLVLMGEAGRQPEAARAAYPGFWLRGPGRPRLLRSLGLTEPLRLAARALLRRLALPLYLSGLALLSLALVAWLLAQAGAATGALPLLLTGALMLFPASEAVIALLHRLISESTRPRQLPRLALGGGIPAAHRVMVVIPCLLTSPAAVRALTRRLELHQLANPEAQAQFGLLSDWADADAASAAADAGLLNDARGQIQALNSRYPAAPGQAARFLLLHRERSYSASEQRWIGWERKRGKLEQLVAALAEGQQAAFLDLGAEAVIAADTRYIVTLDSDTELPPGRLRELVGVAAHPHNQPRLDASGRRLVGGYGILQPQVASPLPDLQDLTPYHWLFAGQCGIDPYSAASSEVYQDLFAEGSFAGKGLLHVQALHAVLAGSLPVARVLSHDLLEGALVRCATLSDINVIEDAPFHADVAAARVHRWTRGDWQLLPFLLNPWRYPIRALNRWKMLDNLRRSLVAPAALALLLLSLASGWLAAPAALALVLAAYMAGPLLGALAALHSHREDLARAHFYRQALADLGRALCGGLWQLQQLLAQALLALDAIVRALYRMGVSHRHLLQWTTAAAAQAAAQTRLPALLRQHRAEPLLAGVLLAGLLLWGTAAPVLACALALLWASAPLAVWWASRPRAPRADAALPAADQLYLRGIARDTWRLFERCIGPDDRQLPPDNLQTLPAEMLAHRTSPTNIGLYLLSCACAREFGWIGSAELVQRLQATLATLATLARHRGHFYNWYDTQSGAPLLPIYVSSVDSGNLSGHLLALAQACLELAAEPLNDAAMQASLAELQQRITSAAGGDGGCAELDWLSADYEATLRSAALDRQASAATLSTQLRALAAACERLAWEPEFGFLYHRKRHLFHIGYRVAEQQLDAGFYDLLASESRLTSLLAIAKGDVPVQHWAALGRPFYAVGRHAALRSWSGSMFEYLMPSLILAEPPGSVLREACCAALHEQIAYAAEQQQPGLPWGISESAFAGRDHSLAYQYAPQGVPRLALRRTPADELVVAPYATALAAQLAPHGATRNLRALQALGARERYGFIEALDFSPARLTEALEGSPELPYAPVATFMSHHQGMSIVALANVLLQGAPQRWGMANAHVAAVASLLHERAPREISTLSTPVLPLPPQLLQRRPPGLLRELLPGDTGLPATQLLSNGRYALSLRANGAGASRWGRLGLTRWRDDALRDAYGSFFFLRRSPEATPVSLSQHPAPDAAASYRAVFHADRVCLHASWPELQAQTTVWVSPEDDIEFRSVELRNLGAAAIELELISAFEPTLSEPRADEAHPAFANLFLRAEWQPAQQALWFERKPRLASEPALLAAHFLVAGEADIRALAVQTDRAQWLGRNRLASQPLAKLQTVAMAADGLAQALDTGLDPVCALALTLRIPAHGKALLTFATAASDQPAVLHAVIDKYRQASHVERASLMSATLASIRLRALRISPDNHAATQLLSTALLYTLTRPDAGATGKAWAGSDKRLLWRYGISGDRPLLLVSIAASQGLGLLRALAQALRLWEWGGLACELVVLNQEPASYQMALQRELALLRERHLADGLALPQGAVTQFHLLRAEEVSAEELATLQALARLHLQADGRPLRQHVADWAALHEQALALRHEVPASALARTAPPPQPAISQGEFASDGSARFSFSAGAAERPQRPWINVLANADFGCHVSEAGGGYSWATNSRMNQLTAWANDPLADPAGEHLLLQDLRSREVWSASAGAGGDAALRYQVSHAQGSTLISHRRGELSISLTWCVDPQAAVKQLRLQLHNAGPRTRHLRVLALAEWLLGASRSDRASVHTERQGGVLFATQREQSAGFGGGTAFLALAGPAAPSDWSCDRREFFDAGGALVLPHALGCLSGGGLDPCAALACELAIAPGASEQRVFLLGYAASPAAARQLAASAAQQDAAGREALAHAQWDELLGATTVATPDPLFDAMVNRWLLYQTLTCRIWAKAGLYQAGGATGFRDHLQDAMALAWAAPARLRAQILLAASRQFPEGDVQHWWHAPGGAGVRTHCSDDLLWLPQALLHYLRASDDQALLDETQPFLDGAPIAPGAADAYDTPATSVWSANVYEHAARCIDHSLRVGAHGLPLMGAGDWNDGMNRVGDQGRGESVWLAWFACQLVASFAPLARQRGEPERAARWEQAAEGWQAALQGPAWDGLWFKRAFFDDGSPLGSHANSEARIDLIAQAWSVLSGAAPLPRQRLAMAAVERELVDHEMGLLRLLHPPLAQAQPSAGYIQAYPPGVRENGGQYSHAGVWALMAQAQLAQQSQLAEAGDLAYRYFTYLSPAHRAADALRGPAYGIEPYVMAGDVYSQPPYLGRGGWSWYTGSAAWLQRAAIESLFGLQLEAHRLSLRPCLPSHWPEARLTLRRGARVMRFLLLRVPPALAQKQAAAILGDGAAAQVLLPGQCVNWNELALDASFVVPLLA